MTLTLSKREVAMLITALDNIVIDYRNFQRRSARKGNSAAEKLATDAVKRYTRLAGRIFAKARP